jgi:hypothetical protein
MNNANGPLHSERPTPAPLTNAPTPPLDTPAVPLSDLLAQAKEMALAGVAAQKDVDAILSAVPTPEQISDQIIAEDSASPCPPPFAALQAVCAQIAAAHEEVKTLTIEKLALEGKLAKRQQEREALDAIIVRQRQDLEAARTALVALDGDGNAPDLAQAIRDLVAARDEGMAQLRALLVEAGYEGPVLNAARNVISAAARWQRQAETSAASYRALSRRVEKSAHDQTVEVKL